MKQSKEGTEDMSLNTETTGKGVADRDTEPPRTRSRRRMPRRARRGISLFGVILGVAVAAVVALGLVSAYGGLVTNTRTQTVNGLIVTADSSIRRRYANIPQFSASLEEGLWSAMPRTAIQGEDDDRIIVTPWGGEITAGGGEDPGTDAISNNRFWIQVEELPEEACQAIASSFINNSSVVEVHANETEIDDEAAVEAQVVEIDIACDGDDDDTVGIVFRG